MPVRHSRRRRKPPGIQHNRKPQRGVKGRSVVYSRDKQKQAGDSFLSWLHHSYYLFSLAASQSFVRPSHVGVRYSLRRAHPSERQRWREAVTVPTVLSFVRSCHPLQAEFLRGERHCGLSARGLSEINSLARVVWRCRGSAATKGRPVSIIEASKWLRRLPLSA